MPRGSAGNHRQTDHRGDGAVHAAGAATATLADREGAHLDDSLAVGAAGLARHLPHARHKARVRVGAGALADGAHDHTAATFQDQAALRNSVGIAFDANLLVCNLIVAIACGEPDERPMGAG